MSNEMPLWAKHFKVNQETWDSLRSQAEARKSTPLDIALDMGLLNENKLLEYERANSGLASLKAVFFNGPVPVDLVHWLTCYDSFASSATN